MNDGTNIGKTTTLKVEDLVRREYNMDNTVYLKTLSLAQII
jgi:hypothetical protein